MTGEPDDAQVAILANDGGEHVLEGCTDTWVPKIGKDLENAGTRCVEQELDAALRLATPRTSNDLPAFRAVRREEIAEGRHGRLFF